MTIVRYLFFLLLAIDFFAANLELTKQEKEFLNKHPVIKVANEMDWPPFDFNEYGKPQGYSIDHIELIAKKLGLKIEYISGPPWVDLLESFKNKQIDLLPVMYKNNIRAQYTLFSEPYIIGQVGIFSTHQNHINSKKDLINITVGMEASDGLIPEVKKQFPHIKIIEIAHNVDLMHALESGKIDAIITNPFLFYMYAKDNPIDNIELVDYITLHSQKAFNTALHIGVRDDWPLLHSSIEKALKSLSETELAALRQRWIGFNSSKIDITKEEQSYLDDRGSIKLCTAPKWMPFDWIDENGIHQGMGAEFLGLISNKINKKIELVRTLDWNESINKVKEKECDILALAKKTKSRMEYLNFTESIVSVPYVIVAKSNQFFIDRFRDISSNKRFAAVHGYAIVEDLQENYPELDLILVRDIKEGLEKVNSGEVFGFLDATTPILSAMHRFNFLDMKIIGKLDLSYDLSIGVRSDDQMLLKILEKSVKDIEIKDRELIYKKWIAVQHDRVIDYETIWKIILISLVIFLIILYWNGKISYANIELSKVKKEVESKNEELKKLAVTDKLTTLYNRVKLDEFLQQEINRSQRYGNSFAVGMVDIDYFKNVNDSYGHQVGDMVLVEIAKLLKEGKRESDIVGRWGGEEFIIIYPETTLDGAKQHIEGIRSRIENHLFSVVKHKTASFGLTMYKKGDTIESLIKRVDDALYQAKELGRNRVVCH